MTVQGKQRVLLRQSFFPFLYYYFHFYYAVLPLGCCRAEEISTSESTSVTTVTTTSPNGRIESLYDLPGLSVTSYSQLGDINIGVTFTGTAMSDSNPAGECSEDVTLPQLALEIPANIAFVTELINQDPRLLPNVSMGFIIRLSCHSIGPTIGLSLPFLPLNKKQSEGYNVSCYHARCDMPETNRYSHDVIGLLGPGLSRTAVTLSAIGAMARLPIVGASEGADELSDKDDHPYFFRVIPPNVYQVLAMLRFISSNGWSYISMLYSGDSYGQTAFENLSRFAGQYSICIATSHRFVHSTNYDNVVTDLLAHSRARAVILFLYTAQYRQLFKAIEYQNAVGHFIWLGSQGFSNYNANERENKTATNPALGSFIFTTFRKHVPEYHDYLRKQNLLNSKNPWLEQIWEYLFDCSFRLGNCDNETSVLESSKLQAHMIFSTYLDAVLAFAHAAHRLLDDKCPGVRGQEARACISGELLRAYLKNTSFDGFHGRVEFDKNQEVKGKYIISQFQYSDGNPSEFKANDYAGNTELVTKQVGIYDSLTDSVEYTNSISWRHIDTLDRIVPWTEWTESEPEGSPPIHVPESVCSGPCSVGEYKIEKEVPCCWECRRCRDNERLVDGNTSCGACPQFTWPDPASGFTTCIDIPLTYSTLEDIIPVVLTTLAIIFIAVYAFTVVAYVVYRNKRVIRASSRELSAIQLLAILLGYLNVLLLQMKPTWLLCNAIYSLLCVSFILLYAPLLVKTVRILRIFQSGKTNNRQLRFISSQSQLLISGCLVLVQIILCGVSFILYPPGATRTQPIWSQKLVELSCDLTLPGLVSFLSYNLVLVCLCSVLAFKVRKLPDNFNESQFIAMCVATTLLIWLAFVPTYFTASRQYVRVFLLSSALLLNHSVALIFLFLPKLYAATFLSQESGKVSNGEL